MVTSAMAPAAVHELTYILLVELLSYQFCSPVRWIETQNVIFGDLQTERLIEIGPSATLTGMAQKTVAARYAAQDAAKSTRRQLLCLKTDRKDIYYEYDQSDSVMATVKSQPTATHAKVPTHSVKSEVPSAPSPVDVPKPAGIVNKMPDCPVSASEIVKSIITIALKMSPAELSFSKTIKELAAGRSSLQNEIIGELSKEFDQLPNNSEDRPLDELCSSIQSSFSGQLGKHSSASTARMISSKMPGGYGITAVRSYLEDRWGLGTGRQDAIVVSALALQPAHRLACVPEANAFWDGITQDYMTENGLSFIVKSETDENGQGRPAVVDVKALELLKKDQMIFNKRLVDLYAKQLNIDLGFGVKQRARVSMYTSDLEKELDLWTSEHGEAYSVGIRPVFQTLKARTYNSYWNWAREDVMKFFYSLLSTQTKITEDIRTMSERISNRATPELLDLIRYLLGSLPSNLVTSRTAREFMQKLLKQCEFSLRGAANVKVAYQIAAPQTIVDADGKIVYSEIPRAKSPENRIHAAHSALAVNGFKKIEKLNSIHGVNGHINGVNGYANGVANGYAHSKIPLKQHLSNGINDRNENSHVNGINGPVKTNGHCVVSKINGYRNTNGINGNRITNGINDVKVPNNHLTPRHVNILPDSDTSGIDHFKGTNGVTSSSNHTTFNDKAGPKEIEIPLLHMCRKASNGWEYNEAWTESYVDTLDRAVTTGLCFADKNVLLTGAGRGSIGFKILEGLVAGGARVVVTTSSYSPEIVRNFQQLYKKHGGRDSQLVVVPCNMGSQQDVLNLVSYIYDSKSGLGWDLDHIIPFAAISENGRELETIDSKSELAHRIMLTNTLRLLGATKLAKAKIGSHSRPAQVILPLSPNHGMLGNDGLYAESKLALESLFSKWHSESWHDYLSICGASIGWTRGTGLMSGTDIVSEGVEKCGVTTFSQEEMAALIMTLMTPTMINICQLEPIFANLNGKMDTVPNIKSIVTEIRAKLEHESEIRRAIAEERLIEEKVIHGESHSKVSIDDVNLKRRPNIKFENPQLPDYDRDIRHLSTQLKDMVDLEKVAVVAGFSEIGPYGNSRTRWEMEAYGEFSLEGCIEMAWIMGLIKHYNGQHKGKQYCGWIDSKTGDPVAEIDVKKKYEKHILDNSGIRLVEPLHKDAVGSYSVQALHEVVIEEDLDPIEVSEETAEDFRREHGQMAEVLRDEASGATSVSFKKGAILMIPKALNVNPTVVGQIPSGWDPRTYGIDENVISQVDQVTLFALISTIEALLSAGITDPYELYQYIHVSELGNCLGSGVGGGSSLQKIFKHRFLEKPVQHDILQESFINTTSAWINMLLFSSSGPLKTPVGACATALESLDSGFELIVSGKAKVVLVGGHDNTTEEMSHEFRNMKATVNTQEELACGRTPREMSRPTASSRSGFVESHGCGIQILTNAKLALEMGLPIHGIIAFTATASDNVGRSIPAPGKGILTAAREIAGKFPSPLLDIKYRRRRLDLRKNEIKERLDSELLYLEEEIKNIVLRGGSIHLTEYSEERKMNIKLEAQVQEREALSTFGNKFWVNDTSISPIRGALAVWGLTINDLDVASFHGTSTILSEKNESDVIHSQLAHLGRHKGNAIMGVFQKHLTGHPKGAAGAWMLNGAMQILDSGLVPGNRNADNVDDALRRYDNIVFPSSSIQTTGIKAVSVTSFGFGQKGSQAIVVHPKYLFATVDKETYYVYSARVTNRYQKAYRCFHECVLSNSMYKEKLEPPYMASETKAYLLNPTARITRQ